MSAGVTGAGVVGADAAGAPVPGVVDDEAVVLLEDGGGDVLCGASVPGVVPDCADWAF
jgi:hypothetical protein